MELIQIFNRKTGKWGKRFKPEPKFQENFVIDKTTDTGKNFTFYYLDGEPDYRIMDWVRVMHVKTANEPAEYSLEGLPLNHNQYLIGAVQAIENEANGYWVVTMQLIEPIERCNGIIGETISYTNQTQKKHSDKVYGDNTYVRDRYNHLTALERWLKIHPANCDLNKSWYSRIKILDAEWLKTLPFDDTTFNELSLYNVLMDNYDSSTGRTPVFYFDMNIQTDLPSDLSRDTYLLKFERQDGFDKPMLLYENLKRGAAAHVTARSLDNYATGLVANVDNLVSGTDISFPAQSLYAAPEVNQDVRDTIGAATPPTYDNSDYWGVRFPQSIRKINKVIELHARQEGAINAVNYAWYPVDISDYVLEKQQFDAFDPDDELGDNEREKELNKYCWYKEGEDFLHIRRYKTDTTAFSLLYYVEYEPYINCRVEYGNTDYAQQINQTAAQPSAEKFGDFSANYLAGMNKADVIIEKNYQNYNSFKDHMGCRVQKGDKEYMITSVSYINRNFQYYVVYQLNENHTRKSDIYQAPQSIRTDVSIATDSLKDRFTNIKQVVRLGLTPQPSDGNSFLVDKKVLFSALVPNDINHKFYPQVAVINVKSTLKTDMGATIDWDEDYLTNIARFVTGKQVCINFQFYDNALAGKEKQINAVHDGWRSFGGTVVRQIPVLFTDPFGEAERLSIDITSVPDALSVKTRPVQ